MRRSCPSLRSHPSRRPLFSALAECAVALSIVGTLLSGSAAASPSRATLLDEPPRLFTFKLDDPASPRLSLLRAFQNAEIESPGPVRRYFGGPWGQWRMDPWQTLSWSFWSGSSSSLEEASAALTTEDGGSRIEGRDLRSTEETSVLMVLRSSSDRLFGFETEAAAGNLRLNPEASTSSTSWLHHLDPEWASLSIVSTGPSFASNGFDVLWAPPSKPVVSWKCRRRPVTFMRYAGESDSFELVRCDGSVAPEALDRLSIMARPPEAPGPGRGELLPDEPEARAWENGEWLPQIRLVHPRLLWALQRIADAFPWRAVYVYSGYRPRARDAGAREVKGGSHHSLHGEARAMDISVTGVSNVSLLELCRKLEDVGCGFYPNSKFVHVDVRRPGTGHAFWIDASGPGEPSRYVDSWPGVVSGGGMAWDSQHAEERTPEGAGSSSAVCATGARAE